jgi:surfeit locus 1 family protein
VTAVRSLLTPRWIAASLIVVVLAVVFASLGFWQLRRMEERQLQNTISASRFQDASLEAEQLIPSMAGDPDGLRWRRVLATGEFRPEDEVLIRSQVQFGVAGFHVITPLVLEDGSAILVNRGWVPLDLDQVPVTLAPPPPGTLTVEGWLEPTQVRRALGPADPESGRLTAMNRVDVERIQEQVETELAPMYMVAMGEQGNELPIPLDPPSFDDEGPHLAYAIQWFSFLVIGLVGYWFLVRRSLRPRSSNENQGE